jgi:hypothetical protein
MCNVFTVYNRGAHTNEIYDVYIFSPSRFALATRERLLKKRASRVSGRATRGTITGNKSQSKGFIIGESNEETTGVPSLTLFVTEGEGPQAPTTARIRSAVYVQEEVGWVEKRKY